MSSVTPPGWYPDDEDRTRLRYWDGSAWTDARTPLAPAPLGVEQPEIPATARIDTVWVWVLASLTIVGIVQSIIGLVTTDPSAIVAQAERQQSTGNLSAEYFTPSSLLGFFIALVLWAAVVVLAYLDHRELTRIGIVRPFHWAFAFIPVALVYLIGRTVVVRRRVHRGGTGPLVLHIALVVVSLILAIIALVVSFTAAMGDIGSSFTSTGMGA